MLTGSELLAERWRDRDASSAKDLGQIHLYGILVDAHLLGNLFVPQSLLYQVRGFEFTKG